MELTMTNGFCELSENEIMETEGGLGLIIAGAVIIIGAVLLTGCSGGNDGGSKGVTPGSEYNDYRCV